MTNSITYFVRSPFSKEIVERPIEDWRGFFRKVRPRWPSCDPNIQRKLCDVHIS